MQINSINLNERASCPKKFCNVKPQNFANAALNLNCSYPNEHKRELLQGASQLSSLIENNVKSGKSAAKCNSGLNGYKQSVLQANYAPISFGGNAPKITNAYIVTKEQDDLPLLITKLKNSYVVDFDSQTELMYGLDAIKYLNSTDNFPYETQVIFPKKSEGTLHIDDKDIKLSENFAVILKQDTKASISVDKGYPMVVLSKKDYDWYERYSKNADDINIRNKFLELIYYNSHLYNGEFTPNVLLPDKLRDEEFLKSISIDKWKSRNNLVNDIYSQKDKLNEEDKKSIEFVKNLLDKLYSSQLIDSKSDGYVRFKLMPNLKFLQKKLKDKGFSEEEITAVSPIYNQARHILLNSKHSRYAIKNPAKNYSPELIRKLKEKGVIYRNKKDADEYIYWRECFGNETELKTKLTKEGFTPEEQAQIVENWRNVNHTGFDMSGIEFINQNAAVYNYADKLNNWTHEKTNWLTNSTTIFSTNGEAPFLGVSLVHADEKKPYRMSEIRREEKLHEHPNIEEKRQTEIYLITSGEAALNVVKNGKTSIKLLKEGDLAVIGPGVAHCLNSILGEYEHIVTQLPSAFQYGFGFKHIVTPPPDYDEEALHRQAFSMLTTFNTGL